MRRAPRAGITIAIDPGASGGFAVRYPDGKIELMAMPEHDVDRIDFIKTIKARSLLETAPIQAVMEKVGGFVRGNPAPGSAMFNFGHGVGVLRGAILTLEIPLIEVHPQNWQKALAVGKHTSKPQHKRALKAKATELYPSLKPTLSTCDALLILDWAIRVL